MNRSIWLRGTLLEWAAWGPAIADIFQDLPDIDEDDCYRFHNGNPFVECEQDLVNVVSKTVVNKESLKSVREAFSFCIVPKWDFID